MKNEKKSSNIRSPAKLAKQYMNGALLQNDTRVNILMYLRMNERLSFSQLKKLIGKSKSTLHHHLQIMIKGGIVQEVIEESPRSQFDPKFYELVPRPMKAYSFAFIDKLPKHQQVDAFLTTTKLTQSSMFYLYQIIALLKYYLDNMEKIILSEEEQTDPDELQKMWEGSSSEELFNQIVSFKDIFIFSTPVNEKVYKEYIKELKILQDKLYAMREEDESKGGSKNRPYFIYHLSAPLGKPYLLD